MHTTRHKPGYCGKSPRATPPVIAGRASTAGHGRADEGGIVTVCLLDREPVLADMTGCDRFEVKEPA